MNGLLLPVSSSHECVKSDDGTHGMLCPQCGYPDVVRARVVGAFGVFETTGARCTTCGHRFRVGRKVFRTLRLGEPGEPYEVWDDRLEHAFDSSMTRTQLVICIIASVLGLVVDCWLAITWDKWLPLGLVFIPSVYFGWLIGRWISPPRVVVPGHCPKCLYNLRGVSTERCPECGAPVDPQ